MQGRGRPRKAHPALTCARDGHGLPLARPVGFSTRRIDTRPNQDRRAGPTGRRFTALDPEDADELARLLWVGFSRAQTVLEVVALPSARPALRPALGAFEGMPSAGAT